MVDIECSDTCEDITATGTNLTSKDGPATFVCKNIASTSKVRLFAPTEPERERWLSTCYAHSLHNARMMGGVYVAPS